MFENMALRRIFVPKRDEVRDEWRKPYNEELSDLYFSPNIVRVIKSRTMRWAGHVACMGRGNTCTGFVEKREGKGLIWRQRGRWEENIKKDVQFVGCWDMDWIELAQYSDRWRALMNALMNARVT